jgi:hypothetical protein
MIQILVSPLNRYELNILKAFLTLELFSFASSSGFKFMSAKIEQRDIGKRVSRSIADKAKQYTL